MFCLQNFNSFSFYILAFGLLGVNFLIWYKVVIQNDSDACEYSVSRPPTSLQYCLSLSFPVDLLFVLSIIENGVLMTPVTFFFFLSPPEDFKNYFIVVQLQFPIIIFKLLFFSLKSVSFAPCLFKLYCQVHVRCKLLVY